MCAEVLGRQRHYAQFEDDDDEDREETEAAEVARARDGHQRVDAEERRGQREAPKELVVDVPETALHAAAASVSHCSPPVVPPAARVHRHAAGGSNGAGDDAHAELERLRAENARLRQQLEDLSKVVQKSDQESPRSPAVEKATSKGSRSGVMALKFAPYDLYIVYSIKLMECAAYYGFAYIYVEFLSEELGFSDSEAGQLYSAYGLLCTVIGLQMGYVIDKMGVRTSMLIGCIASTIARGTCLVTTSKWWACFSAVTFFPVGAAFGVPVLALGVRRYTHEDNRGFAFSFFYAVLCFACLVGSIIINRIRSWYPDGTFAFGHKVTWLRIVVFVCVLLTSYTVIAASFVRDIQVLSDKPLEERAFCEYKPRKGTLVTAMKEVVGQRRFWRLIAVTLIFCGVRMTFRHLDATFPKYFIRTFGPHAPFELILCLQTIITMLATPLVTGVLLKHKVRYDRTLMIGAFISGLSVFWLSISESYTGAIAFVSVLSVGEAIWSPKLYEFSTMAAPEGREGIYVAITMAPMYLASVPVGALSGWALEVWCPKGSTPEQRDTRMMWFVLGLIGFSSPVLLFVFRRVLLRPGDDAPPSSVEEGEGEHRPPGRTKLPRAEKEPREPKNSRMGDVDQKEPFQP